MPKKSHPKLTEDISSQDLQENLKNQAGLVDGQLNEWETIERLRMDGWTERETVGWMNNWLDRRTINWLGGQADEGRTIKTSDLILEIKFFNTDPDLEHTVIKFHTFQTTS